MAEEFWRWSATALANGIARGDVSSREAVVSCLQRIDAVNAALNALVSVQADAALAAATAADHVRASGGRLGILHGVPVTTKINVDQAGLPTTNGVRAFAQLMAATDSPPVKNLRDAGAIVIGRSNTPAFSMRWYTDNDLHGRTLSPWREDRTPGGSSGGAAVAVATGMCHIAHGNDGGGSIRYPAYCTGTVGLRPSFGRVPSFNATAKAERQLSLQLISVQGAITRTVDDARLALQALVSADPRDPWHVAMPLRAPDLGNSVAVCTDPAGVGISAEVVQAVQQAAACLADAGYQVTQADPPAVAESARAWNDFAQGESRIALLDTVNQHGDRDSVRAMQLMMNRTPVLDAAGLMAVTAARATLLRQWQGFMARHTLVLCPVAMEQALPYGVDLQDDASVDRLYRSHVFLFATAFLGLPSIAVPTGLVNGLPMGVQIIGPRFREDLVLDAAQAIERRCTALTPTDVHW